MNISNGRAHRKAADMLMGRWGDYIQSLNASRMPARQRAESPFESHAWVYAAAMTTATVASQAPFTIFRETAETLRLRTKNGSLVRAGRARRAVQRHLEIPILKRLLRKGVEPDYEHPLYDVFLRPNPFQDGNQFFQLTHLWLAIRGECFWVMQMEDGSPVPPNGIPDMIWPLSPDLFKPVYEYGQRGPLVAWEMIVPRYFASRYQRMFLSLDQVIQFKFVNPTNPLRGMSRLSASAAGIETDLLIQTQNRALIENESVPRGIITHPDDQGVDNEKKFKEKFDSIHKGPDKAGRTAILTGGFQYTPIQMSPAEAQYLERLNWDREEILAVMNMPKSVLGITEHINYATQLGQDKNLWDKNIMPMLRIEETAIDSGLFHQQNDSVFGGFDVSGVEALRSGIQDKVTIANTMAGQALHTPPRIAFEVVGLEVPEYEGDEEVLVNAVGATPLSQVLGGSTERDDSVPAPPAPSDKRLVVKAKSRHAEFILLESALEGKYKSSYRGWIVEERTKALRKFDEGTKSLKIRTKASVNIQAIMVDLKEMQARLKGKVRPIYAGTLESTFKFTVDDLGGMAVFEMDDPKLLQFFDQKLKRLLETTPKTLATNLHNSILEGMKNGETVQELRQRIGEVFDISASSSKVLSVARTETAGFMNGTRRQMFELAGIKKSMWSASGDEIVRESHQLYGDSGAHDLDFNYLDLSGNSGGTLSHPGDLRCTNAAEIVSCRCMEQPV